MHHVDPSKPIKAPYSQRDVVVFGQNARQQCVAMSQCTSIYHNMYGPEKSFLSHWYQNDIGHLF